MNIKNKVIAIVSGKGGVGKSFVTSMMASEMNKKGYQTAVLDADITELTQVPGVGAVAAAFIKTYPAVSKRYFSDRFRPGKKLIEYQKMGKDLVLHFAGCDVEQAYAIFYDNSLGFCGAEVIHEGDINTVGFSFRKLCDAAVRHKAAYMILAHNHPHGLPIASSADLNTTSELQKFLLQMNVVLIDHFIVGENRFTSTQKNDYEYLYRHFVTEKEVFTKEDFK